MSDRIGGWTVTGAGGQNTPYAIEKTGKTDKQHVVYGLSASFNGAASTPVLCQLVNPDVSPNTVLWEGYVSQYRDPTFAAGITVPAGCGVTLMIGAGGGSLVGSLTLHGTTR